MRPFVQWTGVLIAFSLLSPCAQAQEAAPSVSRSGNLNLVNEYRFRGIDQTWGRPALQGGADITHVDGWYAGFWASNVQGRSYPGGGVELDLYGGYNGKIGGDWGYTVGLYGYVYPGANVDRGACPSAAYSLPCVSLPNQRYDTLEVNAGVSWKWLAYRMSVSTSDYFGANVATGYSRGTRGTAYHDLTATVPLSGSTSLIVHAGCTDLRARAQGFNPSYADWRVALARTFEGDWNASIGAVGATNDRFYRPPTGGLSATDGASRALNRPVMIVQIGVIF